MTESATRLWDKGGQLDRVVHRFTVGDDPEWDMHLVHWDCLGSAAHARTLHRAKLLSDADLAALLAGFAQIDALHRGGRFAIPRELEDCHTAIEAHLTKTCGEAGGRIHTGRSRNDQVATAMRLFMRDAALGLTARLEAFAATLIARIRRDGDTPMPGYTHLQPAMPSSVGQWLHAAAEAALDQLRATLDLLNRLDACPLGSGAGFGVPLPLDRRYTAELLGFARVQRSPIDVQNSRGRMESYFVRVAADVGAILEKLSWDLILMATAEFGIVRLPERFTTGSSIMPQKRNPDVLELMRARSARLRSRLHELEAVCGKLPSSYHRDLQLTKEPAIRSAGEITDMLRIAASVIDGVEFDRQRLEQLMRPELFATAAALAMVQRGVPFREAYREVGRNVREGKFDASAAAGLPQAGLVDPATIAELEADIASALSKVRQIEQRVRAAEAALLPAATSP